MMLRRARAPRQCYVAAVSWALRSLCLLLVVVGLCRARVNVSSHQSWRELAQEAAVASLKQSATQGRWELDNVDLRSFEAVPALRATLTLDIRGHRVTVMADTLQGDWQPLAAPPPRPSRSPGGGVFAFVADPVGDSDAWLSAIVDPGFLPPALASGLEGLASVEAIETATQVGPLGPIVVNGPADVRLGRMALLDVYTPARMQTSAATDLVRVEKGAAVALWGVVDLTLSLEGAVVGHADEVAEGTVSILDAGGGGVLAQTLDVSLAPGGAITALPGGRIKPRLVDETFRGLPKKVLVIQPADSTGQGRPSGTGTLPALFTPPQSSLPRGPFAPLLSALGADHASRLQTVAHGAVSTVLSGEAFQKSATSDTVVVRGATVKPHGLVRLRYTAHPEDAGEVGNALARFMDDEGSRLWESILALETGDEGLVLVPTQSQWVADVAVPASGIAGATLDGLVRAASPTQTVAPSAVLDALGLKEGFLGGDYVVFNNHGFTIDTADE